MRFAGFVCVILAVVACRGDEPEPDMANIVPPETTPQMEEAMNAQPAADDDARPIPDMLDEEEDLPPLHEEGDDVPSDEEERMPIIFKFGRPPVPDMADSAFPPQLDNPPDFSSLLNSIPISEDAPPSHMMMPPMMMHPMHMPALHMSMMPHLRMLMAPPQQFHMHPQFQFMPPQMLHQAPPMMSPFHPAFPMPFQHQGPFMQPMHPVHLMDLPSFAPPEDIESPSMPTEELLSSLVGRPHMLEREPESHRPSLVDLLPDILDLLAPHHLKQDEGEEESTTTTGVVDDSKPQPMVLSLKEKDDFYVVSGWLPGVAKKDLEITLDGSDLVVNANITQKQEGLGQFSDIDVLNEVVELPYAPNPHLLKAHFDDEKATLTAVFPREQKTAVQVE